jgi:multiple sugar transport system substrate-binding protein
MMLVGQWYEPTLIQDGMKPDTDFGAFVMPTITPGLTPQVIYESSPIVVSAHNPNKEQAIKAVDTFMRPDVQQKWVAATSFVSADSSVPANNAINVQINKDVASNHITLHNRYWEATPPQIAVPAAAALIQFVLHPDTYMQVLQNCDSLAQQYWSTHK